MTANPPIHFPPEWAEQSAVLLAWPHGEGEFSPWLADVEASYESIALAIAKRERLIIACRDEALQQHVTKRLSAKLDSISFAVIP